MQINTVRMAKIEKELERRSTMSTTWAGVVANCIVSSGGAFRTSRDIVRSTNRLPRMFAVAKGNGMPYLGAEFQYLGTWVGFLVSCSDGWS